jgi:hypothetical protein
MLPKSQLNTLNASVALEESVAEDQYWNFRHTGERSRLGWNGVRRKGFTEIRRVAALSTVLKSLHLAPRGSRH